jgi:hypothetical protein
MEAMKSFDPYERCGPDCKAFLSPFEDNANGREHQDCPQGICATCGGENCPDELCNVAEASLV